MYIVSNEFVILLNVYCGSGQTKHDEKSLDLSSQFDFQRIMSHISLEFNDHLFLHNDYARGWQSRRDGNLNKSESTASIIIHLLKHLNPDRKFICPSHMNNQRDLIFKPYPHSEPTKGCYPNQLQH